MEMTVKNRAGAVILELQGKFDIETALEFESRLNQVVADQPKVVALNFGQVSYVDSTGTAALIKSTNLVRGYGGELHLYNLKDGVLNVFKLSQLENMFSILTLEEFDGKYPE